MLLVKIDESEVICRKCKNSIKPIISKNKLKQNFYGQTFNGTEKKYLLICPNCKAIIGLK